jgi:hypothetical protein
MIVQWQPVSNRGRLVGAVYCQQALKWCAVPRTPHNNRGFSAQLDGSTEGDNNSLGVATLDRVFESLHRVKLSLALCGLAHVPLEYFFRRVRVVARNALLPAVPAFVLPCY